MEEPLEVLEGSDCEIDRLFPKCQPRYFLSNRSSVVTDLNLNKVGGSNDNDNYRNSCYSTPQSNRDEEVTSYGSSISRMSVDTVSATSSASGSHSDASVSSSSSNSVHCDGTADIPATTAGSYLNCEETRSSALDISYEERPVRQPPAANVLRQEHYRLRDSRIEVAGGREVYSQSRNRPRKRHSDPRRLHSSRPFYYHNTHMSSHSSSQANQAVPRRQQINLSDLRKETSSSRSNTTTTSPESSFEDGVSESSDPIEEASASKVESPLVYETQLAGSSEVVFDDIGEWVTRGLHVKGYSEDSREKSLTGYDSFSHSHSEEDSETEDHSLDRVKKIGNVPIAEYEGSPRRYGMKTSTMHHSPRSLYLLPPVHRMPRPGFPRRVSSDDKKSKETFYSNSPPVWEKCYSQKRDKVAFRSSSNRDKKNSSKTKSRTNTKESRPEVPAKSKEVESINPPFNSPEDVLDKNIGKCSVMTEYYKQDDESLNYNCNSISLAEVEEKLAQTPTISISTLASVYSSYDDRKNVKRAETIELSPKMDLSDITNTLSAKYCNYEESETHKVLAEFFQDSNSKLSRQDFLDLDYILKRHQGNSYVGQRLASEIDPDDLPDLDFSKEKIDLINQLPCVPSIPADMISMSDELNVNAEDDVEVSQASCFNHTQPSANTCNPQQITENTSSSSSLSCLEGTPSKSSSDMLDANILKTNPNLINSTGSYLSSKGEAEEDDSVAPTMTNNDQRALADLNKHVSCRIDGAMDSISHCGNHPNKGHSSAKRDTDHLEDEVSFVNDTQNEEIKYNASIFRETNMPCTSSSAECIFDSLTTRQTQCYSDAQLTPQQVETGRNLTMSPTTTCDSVEAESEFSGGELEGSVHSSQKGVCPTMPILEDGLSSGDESDSGVMISQSNIIPDTELANHQLSSEDIEINSNNLIEIERQIDPKTSVDLRQQDIVLAKSYQSRARCFDEHLCRGELPVIGNRIGANNIRHDPHMDHSFDESTSPGQYSNSLHGFSFNIPESENMLTHSSPYNNSQPSPSSSTLSLMKKQITEIEIEIALKKPECLSRKYDQDFIHSLDIHTLDPLSDKICEPPPPPAPHPHRGSNDIDENGISGCTTPGYSSGVLHSPQLTQDSIPGPQLLSAKGSVGSPVQATHMLHGQSITQDIHNKLVSNSSPSRESVEAAIADIKQAIRKTKSVSLKTYPQERRDNDKGPVWVPRSRLEFCEHSTTSSPSQLPRANDLVQNSPSRDSIRSRDRSEEDGDTDQETDRLLGRQRSRDPAFLNEKSWRKSNSSRASMQNYLAPNVKEIESDDCNVPNSSGSATSTPVMQSHVIESNDTPLTDDATDLNKKEKEKNKKKGKSKEVLIEGVLFRARYLGSTQLVSEGQPTKTTRMMQAEEAVSRIKALQPEGEPQPSTEVDLFISTEKIMVLNTDLKEIMMDHALRTISYIADIGDLVVLMARRRVLPSDELPGEGGNKTPKMICHVFESDEAQFIAQSIGQAFQVAYLEFLKANGIEDHSFVKEMDYQEVLNSQEIFGDELQMFAKKELQKEVVVPKMKGEILGVVVVESGWGSMVPTVVIANLSPTGAAAKCGQLNIGDQIIAINGVSLVGLPLSTCQNYIKNTKYNTAVKLTVVPCPPVVEVKIRRPDTKYQLGFSVQNGVICSLLRGGIAERGGVRVGHRIIDINSQSVVAVPHEKIVNLLATSVGEIRMKTMPTSIFRLLTGQETPQYI